MAKKLRNVTITGLSIQFDADIEANDTQGAKDAARKVVDAVNEALSAAGLSAEPQVIGGFDIDGSQVEIGEPLDGSDEEGERQMTMCKHCDHFIGPNMAFDDDQIVETKDTTIRVKGDSIEYARFEHFEDGEQEFDHNPEPGETKTLAEWEAQRPDLFKAHPDGAIGPNSKHHSQRGKLARYGKHD